MALSATEHSPGRAARYAMLVVGTLAISTAAPLIRSAGGADPALLGAGRLGLAALLLLPVAVRRPGSTRAVDAPTPLWLLLLSGLLLGAHFWTWIASLSYTSVASSVAIVTLNPVFVGLAQGWLLGEPTGRGFWVGAAIAAAGAGVLFVGDLNAAVADATAGSDPLWGDLLALAGAIFASGHWLCGRRLRRTLSAPRYAAATSGIAALVLLPAAGVALMSPATRLDATLLWAVVGLALIPHLAGHLSFNWALRYVPPAMVALFILFEPVGASLITWGVWAETPRWTTVVGGAVILAGVAVGILHRDGKHATGDRTALRRDDHVDP